MLKEQKRHLVVPIELTERSEGAVKYVLEQLWREGDVINLVHVVKASESTTEIFHGPAGSSFSTRDPLAGKAETSAIDRAKECIKTRFTDEMDRKGVMHNLHLFLDTENAPPSAVWTIIKRVCEDVSAEVIVMAASNKGLVEKALMGSVASYVASNSGVPVLLVK